MAKVKGPLLSIRASGSIGKSLTFGSWRGIPYSRQLVIPANPRTVEQTKTRSLFSWLTDLFRMLGPISRLPWALASAGRPFTDRNAHVRGNLAILRGEVEVTDYSASPGARGGPALVSFTAVPGGLTKQILVTMNNAILPSGWTVASFNAMAILQQNPQQPLITDLQEGTAAPPGPGVITLTMAAANELYVVNGWATYIRDDGSQAVSPASTNTSLSAV